MTFIIDILKQNHRLDSLKFLICIVGSRKLSSTEGVSWSVLEPNLTILGFDADEDACILDNERFAKQKANWQELYIPLVLSNQCNESTLYVTKAIHCSSLYPPNEPYLARFMGMDQGIQLDFSVGVETTTLDQLIFYRLMCKVQTLMYSEEQQKY